LKILLAEGLLSRPEKRDMSFHSAKKTMYLLENQKPSLILPVHSTSLYSASFYIFLIFSARIRISIQYVLFHLKGNLSIETKKKKKYKLAFKYFPFQFFKLFPQTGVLT